MIDRTQSTKPSITQEPGLNFLTINGPMNTTPQRQRPVRMIAFLAIALTASQFTMADNNVYQAAIKSTTLILAESPAGVAGGTGVLIDREQRLIITNEHVVEDAETVIVFFPVVQQGQINCDQAYYLRHIREIGFQARVLAVDSGRDVALLQLDELPDHARAIEIGPSAQPGQEVHSIGNPSSSDALWIYTHGYVRANYYKSLSDSQSRNMQVLETTSPTNEGDSGGPILNNDGQLVGITQSYTIQGRLVSNGVDISEITWFVNKTLNGRVTSTATLDRSNQDQSRPRPDATSSPSSRSNFSSKR